MNRVLRLLLFCGVTASILLPAEEKMPDREPVPQRELREILKDQKNLAYAAGEMIFGLDEAERTKLAALCRSDPERARTFIVGRLEANKLRKQESAEAIQETSRLFRQAKEEAEKEKLRARLRELLAEQYNRTSAEIAVRLRLQELRLEEVRLGYRKRVENADRAIDAQLNRIIQTKKSPKK